MTTKKKAVITARVDLDTKERARQVFENAGLDMTTAINIYLKKKQLQSTESHFPSLRTTLLMLQP